MHRLPHKPPVKFVEKVLFDHEFDARALVRFPFPPTLPMLVEAAAQTSVFVRVSAIKAALGIPEDDTVQGMLLKMKAAWIEKSAATAFEIHTKYVSNLENFFVMEFEVYDKETLVAGGSMNTIIQKSEEGA
jgi:hypothetical protein